MACQGEGGGLGPQGEILWLTMTREKADQPFHGLGEQAVQQPHPKPAVVDMCIMHVCD